MELVNINQKLDLFSDYWSPKIIGEMNGMHIKLAKFKGEFVWHKHDDEDEMFLILKGKLLIKFRDKDVWLNEGEFIIVPKGVEHLPVAESEVSVMLIEPISTLNTGDTVSELTKQRLDKI